MHAERIAVLTARHAHTGLQGSPCLRLRTRPAHGHDARRLAKDLDDRTLDRQFGQCQTALISELDGLPRQPHRGSGRIRPLDFDDQDRVHGLLLPVDCELGIGVNRVVGIVRLRCRLHLKANLMRRLRRGPEFDALRRFDAPIIDHCQPQATLHGSLAPILERDFDRNRLPDVRHLTWSHNPYGQRSSRIDGIVETPPASAEDREKEDHHPTRRHRPDDLPRTPHRISPIQRHSSAHTLMRHATTANSSSHHRPRVGGPLTEQLQRVPTWKPHAL